MDAFTAHEVRIARQTLAMPDAMVGVMGGMTKEQAKKVLRKVARREKEEVMRSLGLTKVRGNLGGTYWE